MDRDLEVCLYQAILEDDHDAIKLILSQGANPNEVMSNGKTCLGEAVLLGKINILKILLDQCKIAEKKHYKPQKRKLNTNEHEQTAPKCFFGYNFNRESPEKPGNTFPCTSNGKTESNRGYYVFIHDDESSMEEGSFNFRRPGILCMTPSPQADLEWDEDIGNFAAVTSEDETWSSMYKWYAEILESTGSAWESAVPCGIDQQDAFSKTALHYAVEKQDITALKQLIDSGCRLDIPADKGMTPLHVAILKKYRDVVEILLAAGSRVNQRTHDKLTALHMAASKGYLEIVQRLVKAGANLEARDTNERTPLYLAARRGHGNVIKFLVAIGANVNTEEIHGYTPLCEAVWQRYTSVIEILLQSGARIIHSHRLLHNAILQKQEEIVEMLSVSTSVINLHNDSGNTPLLLATRTSQSNVCRLLLRRGANVNLCNSLTGVSVLHAAVETANSTDEFEKFLFCFLDYKVNINIMALTRDTALHRALLLHKDHAAVSLIKHGADVNAWDLRMCGLDNLTIASKSSSYLALLLLKAGHSVVNRPFTGPRSTVQTLDRVCSMPLELKDLCRIQIRSLCKNKILYQYVEALPLPKSLKDFVMLKYL